MGPIQRARTEIRQRGSTTLLISPHSEYPQNTLGMPLTGPSIFPPHLPLVPLVPFPLSCPTKDLGVKEQRLLEQKKGESKTLYHPRISHFPLSPLFPAFPTKPRSSHFPPHLASHPIFTTTCLHHREKPSVHPLRFLTRPTARRLSSRWVSSTTAPSVAPVSRWAKQTPSDARNVATE